MQVDRAQGFPGNTKHPLHTDTANGHYSEISPTRGDSHINSRHGGQNGHHQNNMNDMNNNIKGSNNAAMDLMNDCARRHFTPATSSTTTGKQC